MKEQKTTVDTKEISRFIILRFDNYINAVNTKGNFLLAFNTFLCGSIVANFEKIHGLIECPDIEVYVNMALLILFILSILTALVIITSVYPFLKSGNSSIDSYHSVIFFNSVSEFSDDKIYFETLAKKTDLEIQTDLAKQVYHLSKGLKRKFKFLDWAMRFVYCELGILIILATIITFY